MNASLRLVVLGVAFVRRFLSQLQPGLVLLLGYSSYILLGWGLLALPWSRATTNGTWLDLLFVSTSAVSTTGLSPLSTGNDFTGFGQGVVLLLLQLGGLGYMVLGSFLVLATTGKLNERRASIVRYALSLPASIEVNGMLRLITLYTLVCEALGALLLTWRFSSIGIEQPLWQGIFHAASAFSTAGFGLLDNSLENYKSDWVINGTIIGLSYAGAIGFLIVNDLWKSMRERKFQATLTSKIILISTSLISSVTILGLLIEEKLWAEASFGDAFLMAWFQAMSASTTVGFNSVPIGELTQASAFLLLLCMLIGSSPCGTGGGIKTTSVTACWSILMATLRGNPKPTFFGREIPELRRRLAVATVMFYLITLSVGIYCIAIVETQDIFDLAFECASALGTVGLSRGITGQLGDPALGILIVLMFIGRIGPLALAASFFHFKSRQAEPQQVIEEDIVI